MFIHKKEQNYSNSGKKNGTEERCLIQKPDIVRQVFHDFTNIWYLVGKRLEDRRDTVRKYKGGRNDKEWTLRGKPEQEMNNDTVGKSQ